MASSETRLCERCWRPLPVGTPCLVQRHVDRARPLLRTPTSYRHLTGDPACTGAQRNGRESAGRTTP